jgi:hypothetical protein
MAQDGMAVGLEHSYLGDGFKWVTEVGYAALDADEENPIFNESNDVDRVTFSSRAFFPGAFGWKKWVPNVGVIFGNEDSDVDFNDTTTWMISAAALRRF